MKPEQHNIYIVGAGISGLIAAINLEQQGFAPVILEATDRPGGRVKTDVVEGFQLDHGFQVLLSDYPAAQKYLDYEALDLQAFAPGAGIFVKRAPKFFGDPLRNPSLLFSTLFSGIGSLWDKVKILQLNLKLRGMSVQDIFARQEVTTQQYLKDFGFSEGMIAGFFRPFFTGIFLETELQTSSRMFAFVFKMFGEGLAVLPKGGIEAIAQQLTKQLQQTTFRLNTKVAEVQENSILLENGERLATDYTLIATAASKLLPTVSTPTIAWKSCQTLYFTTPKRLYDQPFIGLIAKKDRLINNIFYHNSLATQTKGAGELLSVTVVQEHGLSEQALIAQVQQELKEECTIDDTSFLKLYTIPQALPNLSDLQYEMAAAATKLTDHIFLAGDVQLNGSLNAAMLAGERAALGLVETLKKDHNS